MLRLLIITFLASVSFAAPLTDVCSNSIMVMEGDTCYALSQTYSMTIDEFVACNVDLIKDPKECLIYAGQNYKIPNHSNTSIVNSTISSDPNCPTPSNQTIQISFSQFNAALKASRGDGAYREINCEEYTAFLSQATSFGGIADIDEFAMFLANVIHESDGLKAVREYACSSGSWADYCNSYQKCSNSPASVSYYGRGYIQLTHCYNYQPFQDELAKHGIIVDIINNPDLVAEGTLPLMSAYFYWKKNVHPSIAAGKKFGSTVLNINGALECINPTPQGKPTPQKRFTYYNNIRAVWNMSVAPMSDLSTDCPQI